MHILTALVLCLCWWALCGTALTQAEQPPSAPNVFEMDVNEQTDCTGKANDQDQYFPVRFEYPVKYQETYLCRWHCHDGAWVYEREASLKPLSCEAYQRHIDGVVQYWTRRDRRMDVASFKRYAQSCYDADPCATQDKMVLSWNEPPVQWAGTLIRFGDKWYTLGLRGDGVVVARPE